MTAVVGGAIAVVLFVVLFLRERARLLGRRAAQRRLGIVAVPLLVAFVAVVVIRLLALL